MVPTVVDHAPSKVLGIQIVGPNVDLVQVVLYCGSHEPFGDANCHTEGGCGHGRAKTSNEVLILRGNDAALPIEVYAVITAIRDKGSDQFHELCNILRR